MANEIKRTWCDGIEMAIDAAEFGPGSTGVVVRCGTRRTCKVCRAHDAQAAAEHAAQEAAATLELIRLAEAFGAVPNRPASAGQEAVEIVRAREARAVRGAAGELRAEAVCHGCYGDARADVDRALTALDAAKRGRDQRVIDEARFAYCDALRAVGRFVAEGREDAR